MPFAFSGTTWLDVILTGSIVVPLAILAAVVWLFFRAAKRADDEGRA